jgi:hypothetical protein
MPAKFRYAVTEHAELLCFAHKFAFEKLLNTYQLGSFYTVKNCSFSWGNFKIICWRIFF